MAYFAQIDDNNIVTRVTVVNDSDAPNEAAGIALCKSLVGSDTNWVQTSNTGDIRYRYAGIGMKYDATNDVFYRQQPYASWILNTSTWKWEAPVALPDDAGVDDPDNPDNVTQIVEYTWDEGTTSWTNRMVIDLDYD